MLVLNLVNKSEFEVAVASVLMAQLGDRPVKALEALTAHNLTIEKKAEKMAADFDKEAKKISAALRPIILSAATTEIEKMKAESQYLAQLPSVEEIAAGLLKEQIEAMWTALKVEDKKVKAGRPVSGGNPDGKFVGKFARNIKLAEGVFAVNFRMLSDAQKTKYGLTHAGMWLVKTVNSAFGWKAVESDSPNGLIKASKALLMQSDAPVNNSAWDNGQDLTAEEIAAL